MGFAAHGDFRVFSRAENTQNILRIKICKLFPPSHFAAMDEQAVDGAAEALLKSRTPAQTRDRVFYGIFIVVLVIAQAICDKFQLYVSPGSVLRGVAYAFVQTFRLLGEKVAVLAALLDYIDIRWLVDIVRDVGWALFKAWIDLTVPVAQVILSPWYAIRGYLAYTVAYENPGVLLVGTGILALVVLFAAVRSGVAHWVRDLRARYLSYSLFLGILAIILGCSLYFNAFEKLDAMKIVHRLVYGK